MFFNFLFGKKSAVSDSKFLKLCKSGPVEDILAALNSGANPNATSKLLNYNALMYVVEKNENVNLINDLVNAGADINAQDYCGQTALMHVAEKNENVNLITALVDAGADVNAKSYIGETALMLAVKKRLLENINTLLKAGADVNAKDDYGNTALMLSVGFEEKLNVVRALINANANIDAQDNDGYTTLMRVVIDYTDYKEPDILCLLLESGVDVNIKNKEGKTAFDLAKNAKVFRILNDKDNFVKNPDEWTRINRFLKYCQEGKVEYVASMLEAGINPNVQDEGGCTGIIRAAMQNNALSSILQGEEDKPKILNLLIAAGADVNAREKNLGKTALMFAAQSTENPDILTILINSGADVNIKDYFGKTALYYARDDLRRKILINAGARSSKQ